MDVGANSASSCSTGDICGLIGEDDSMIIDGDRPGLKLSPDPVGESVLLVSSSPTVVGVLVEMMR